jgi:D-alanyl-D-alanine carboxypeptidase/D-alanyl-D-alanine-endopeptidase (penicillin-binding protein 4)
MPLLEALRVINKVSQNLHAEVVLREVARQRRGAGSIEAARAELRAFLAEIGIRPEEFSFQDGSGLSRRNLISPAAVVTLLTHMWNSPHRESWLETLPVAALDGTLKGRFAGTPAADRLRAKTGTLSHVSALSGYLEAPPDRRVAFAVLVNNYNEDSAGVRALIDKLCLAMLEP